MFFHYFILSYFFILILVLFYLRGAIKGSLIIVQINLSFSLILLPIATNPEIVQFTDRQ